MNQSQAELPGQQQQQTSQVGPGEHNGSHSSLSSTATTPTTQTVMQHQQSQLTASPNSNSPGGPSTNTSTTSQQQASPSSNNNRAASGRQPSSCHSSLSHPTGPPQRQLSIPIPNALLNTVNSNKQRQPMCAECEKALPNQIVFDKIESIIRKMQDEHNGLPVKTAKSFMTKIPSVFTGTDLVQWMMKNLRLEDQQEAIHLANLIASHGYIFPIEDHTLSIKNDCTFYRFQTPYLWPSNNIDPENTDYAVYLCKRTMQGKTRLELADYEAENLARLQKMFSRKWEFIFMQAESQAKVDKKRDKLERKVLDSQERAFWDVYRPVPGCVNTTELDIKKACRLSKSAKRCSECQKVASTTSATNATSQQHQQQAAASTASSLLGQAANLGPCQMLAPSPSPEVAQMKGDYQVHRLSFKQSPLPVSSSHQQVAHHHQAISGSIQTNEKSTTGADDDEESTDLQQSRTKPQEEPGKEEEEEEEEEVVQSKTSGTSNEARSREEFTGRESGQQRVMTQKSQKRANKEGGASEVAGDQAKDPSQSVSDQQTGTSTGNSQATTKHAHHHHHSHSHHPHHHHHHHHPHSHGHHHHHHHNRQCPHHHKQQQQQQQQQRQHTKTAIQGQEPITGGDDKTSAQDASSVKQHHQTKHHHHEHASKCQNQRCSLRNKQRSSGSVEQLMGVPAASISRRKSECNRLVSTSEAAASADGQAGKTKKENQKSCSNVQHEPSTATSSKSKPSDHLHHHQQQQQQDERSSSACSSLMSSKPAATIAIQDNDPADSSTAARGDNSNKQTAATQSSDTPAPKASTKATTCDSKLKRKSSLNISTTTTRPPSADQALLAPMNTKDSLQAASRKGSITSASSAHHAHHQHLQRAQLKGAQSICGPPTALSETQPNTTSASTTGSQELHPSGGGGSASSQTPFGLSRVGSAVVRPVAATSTSAATAPAISSNMNDLERELESLRVRLDRGGVKMSKVTQSYLSYFNQWAEYDPFIAQPLPSNPWQSDSTELWDSERQTKDVHCRRVRRWAFSLKELLNDPAGREQFHRFLEKEFSAENLKFWDAVQELKRVHAKDVARRVETIWTEYLAPDANCPINIDSKSYETSKKNMAKNKNNRYIFDEAAGHVYQLMKNDSYPRYLRSDMYKDYKEASERRRPNQVAFDVFKPQITTLKHKFNF